jgi:hypothetical protein
VLSFLSELKLRNETLYYFGWACLVLAVVFLVLARTTSTQVLGVNAWYKPFKFAFSTFTYAWAMGWYCAYLPDFSVRWFNLAVVLLLGFEIAYIALQAGKGELSHFNISTPLHSTLYSLMAGAASAVTLYTAYVGWLFFTRDLPHLPTHYLWAIRAGILLFVVFSFEGFAMGSRMNHSVGAWNDNSNLFIVGWSRTVGDLRVAHFLGMHALQLLPLLSFYLLRSTGWTLALAGAYALLATATLVQAFNGKPLLPAVPGTVGVEQSATGEPSATKPSNR